MQTLERPPASPKQPPKEFIGAPKEQSKETSALKSLFTKLGDVVRDVDTANKMAKDKFDGESALMQAARGALTTGVGVGLEKAMDGVWERVWNGQLPYFEKMRFGEDVGKKLNNFAQTESRGQWKAKLAHLIKEGTQDLSIVGIYNFIAFRTQPIFQKAEAKHVLTSLALNPTELLLAPDIKQEMQLKMDFSKAKLEAESNMETARIAYNRELGNFNNKGDSPEIASAKLDLEAARAKFFGLEPQGMIGSDKQKFVRSIINVNNPVTVLGVDMMWSGMNTLVRNFKEVRKVRGEKGGLEGKRVFMPKKDHYHGDRPHHNDRRQSHDNRSGGQSRDKVYYGKSRWNDQKALEEYELKGS